MRFLASVVLAATLTSIVHGQSSRDKVSFSRDIRVGYPPGPHSARPDEIVQSAPMFRSGAWAPVYVHVQNTGKYSPESDGPAIVSVEVPDSDDTLHTYSAPLPPFDEGGSSSAILYTRAGSRHADFTIRVQARGRDLCKPDQRSYSALDANQILYFALGSRLPGLKLPGWTEQNTNTNMGARAEMALITRIAEMPPQWFGYGSADLVLLMTSDRDFISALVSDQTGRKAALAEWVRRGGRLIVCAGKNRDQFAGSTELQALLPMTIEGPYVAPEASLRWREGGGPIEEPLAHADEKPLEFTRLRPREGRAVRVLIDGPTAGGDQSPLIVQAPYGLGRVTLAAFDIDQRPLFGWKGESEFWEQLLMRSGPRVSAAQHANQFGFGRFGADEGDETQNGLVNRLEQFEGVPVISFGWVALFILLYILVVGPLDYLFLKKVVKRLELTWITFPTIVLAVSAAAYFTAYHLKGSDLRINRVDLVDYDFQSKQAYGRSFFSIFSPRIQKYTIGVAPSEGWAGPPADPAASGTVVSWFGAPKMGRQSFFRNSYEYARLAEGLIHVPINVWSTKGMQAWWQAPFGADQLPFAAALAHAPNRTDEIFGTVTNQLPVDLEDAILIYRGSVANLGTMLRGAPKTVSAERMKFAQWYATGGPGESPPTGVVQWQPGQTPGYGGNPVAQRLNLSMLFHDATRTHSEPSNGAMRDIDQSWRANDANRDEAILVARLPQASGAAESINSADTNPTRIWLGDLPSTSMGRPALQGTMRQDVYVRVFIPITTARGTERP
jgi:hypothetical protein